ncbi:MAG: hypothetical protein QM760_20695 [Nibricoccus sp.]
MHNAALGKRIATGNRYSGWLYLEPVRRSLSVTPSFLIALSSSPIQ